MKIIEEKYIHTIKMIEDIFSKTTDDFSNQYFYFLWWGFLMPIGYLLHFFQTNYILIWAIIPLIGFIGSFIYSFYLSIKNNVTTYLNFALNTFWIIQFISIAISVFISTHLSINPAHFSTLLIGIGTLFSGIIMKLKIVYIGGIIMILLALAGLFVSKNLIPLLHGLAYFLGLFLPFIIIKLKPLFKIKRKKLLQQNSS